MSALTDALQAIAANPDDLTQLPHLIAQVAAIEEKEFACPLDYRKTEQEDIQNMLMALLN